LVADYSTFGRYVTCVFEDGNYSFISTSIGLGTALLSQNNVWSGNNYFKTQSQGNLTKLAATSKFVTLGIANARENFLTSVNTWTGDSFFITQPQNTNNTLVATCAYSDRQATITANAILARNETWTGINQFFTANPGTDTLQGATCEFVTEAVANVNNSLLSTNNTWLGTNLFTSGIPLSDSSGREATTFFIDARANVTYNTIINGYNVFTGSNTVLAPEIIDNSFKACPTQWVNDRLTEFQSGAFTFTGNAKGTTSVTSDNTQRVATTAFINNLGTSLITSLLSSTNSWSGTNTGITQTLGDSSTKICTTHIL
jgi:hypothetical protein